MWRARYIHGYVSTHYTRYASSVSSLCARGAAVIRSNNLTLKIALTHQSVGTSDFDRFNNTKPDPKKYIIFTYASFFTEEFRNGKLSIVPNDAAELPEVPGRPDVECKLVEVRCVHLFPILFGFVISTSCLISRLDRVKCPQYPYKA
jgi:hypothetical protein